MRRFSLMIFALVILVAVVTVRKDDAERPTVDQSASTTAKALEQGGMRQPGEPSGEQSVISEESEAAGALLKTAAILGERPGAAAKSEPSGFVTSAPAHIPASAKAGGIDPALEGLTGRDLNSAAQSELKRLGCYEAKVDGKWGRKSRDALEAFSERAGGAWSDASRSELVTALRNYPVAYCTAECAEKTAGGQCVVAAAPKAHESGEAGKDKSYLPPWMQDAKLTNIEPAAATAPDQKTLPDAAPVTSKPKKSKNVRRRGGDGGRVAQRYERRRPSPRSWGLANWPRAD